MSERRRENELKARIAYAEQYISGNIKQLPSYLEQNGAGYPLGEVLGEILSQNNKLIQARKDLTQLRLDRDGLFAATSGPGAQPARA